MRSSIALSLLVLAGRYFKPCNARALASPPPPLVTKFPTPSEDPFYRIPPNIAYYSPGQVLRSRTVHTTEFGSTVNARELFYRTTLNSNQATGTVATLYLPAIPAFPPKIISYQAAEDALDIRCNPSWANVNASSEQEAYLTDVITPLATYALAQGWYFVNADVEDANSEWLVGVTEGRATLDGIRATIADLGLPKSQTSIALLGYSGGAHETVWASSIAANYAPDLKIVGAAYGGTPIDLRPAYQLLNGGPDAVLAGGAIVGLSRGYPRLAAALQSLATPAGKKLLSQLGGPDACLVEDGAPFANVNFSSPQYFKSDPLQNPIVSDVLARESLLSNVSPLPIPVPTFPRHQWHGTNDTTVPYAPEAEYVAQQCAKGADIIFVPYPGLDHGTAAIAGIPGALLFTTLALDGLLIKIPCGANMSTPAVGSAQAIELLGTKVDTLLQALL